MEATSDLWRDRDETIRNFLVAKVPLELLPDLKALESNLQALGALARYDRWRIESIRSKIPNNVPLILVGEQAEEVIGLRRLHRLGEPLLSEDAASRFSK